MGFTENESKETSEEIKAYEKQASPEGEKLNVEELKKKYGKIYRISASFSEDDESEREMEVAFIFKKPLTASLNRYLRTASKNMTASTTAFLLDNIIPEQKAELEKKIEEYPALTIGIGQKLLNVLGLSDNINLTKL